MIRRRRRNLLKVPRTLHDLGFNASAWRLVLADNPFLVLWASNHQYLLGAKDFL